MGGVVVVKWGGGLITHKDRLCSANSANIAALAIVAAQTSKKLIIVHGAGSFGHHKAKASRLSEGEIEGLDQHNAIAEVRADMLVLNTQIMESLAQNGVDAAVFPPRNWAKGFGAEFSGALPLHSSVTVVFGDVVVDDSQGFGILSGDDIVARYSIETPGVERLVFAIGGVDGILRVPPEEATADDLIEVWTQDTEFEGIHSSNIDVTGGIGLKADRAALVASHGIEVLMVNGEHPKRVLDAIEGRPVRGTRFPPSNS
jgi:isopentenyl phosphate kinase